MPPETDDDMSTLSLLPFLCQGGAETVQSRIGDYGAW